MVILFWQGLGYLVAVVVFGCSLVANLICNATVGGGYWEQHQWPIAVSLIIAAAICWFLAGYLRKRSDRVAIDKETGQEFVVNQSRHTLFFIPIEYWSPILLVIALILLGVEFWGER